MSKGRKIWLWLCLSALVLSMAAGASAPAATINPAIMADTSWDLVSTTKTSVQRLGKTSFLDMINFQFHAGNQFTLTMEDEETFEEISFSGNYNMNTKGAIAVGNYDYLDEQEVKEFLEWTVEEVAEEVEDIEPEDIEILSIDITSFKITGKVKQRVDKKTGLVSYILSMSGKITAKADAQYYDYDEGMWVPIVSKISVSFKGNQTQDWSAYEGTDWYLDTKGASSIKIRTAKSKYTDNDIDLILYEKEEGFEPAEFDFIDGDGDSFSGSYTISKGNYVFNPDFESLEDYIYTKIINYLEYDENEIDLSDELWLTKLKATGKVKTNKKTGEKTISVSMKFSFATFADLYKNGFYYDWAALKGYFTFKGSGAEDN